MATRGFVLSHEDLTPTANAGEFVLRSTLAVVQDQLVGGAMKVDVFTTFLISDTANTIATKIAAAARAAVAGMAGVGAIAANDLLIPSYAKA